METDHETLDAELLHRMSYSELKKVAKKHGVKGNMKAEKIIKSLMSKSTEDLTSFSTPSQTRINSSRKNKVEKFDVDQMTPLDTPRRGTYTLESPSDCFLASKSKLDDTKFESPAADSFVEDLFNVTLTRGSERKLRPRKVSFISPKKTPRSPKYISLKDRPKTPIASRLSVSKQVSFSTPVGQQRKKSIEKTLRVTPHPHSKIVRDSTSNKNVLSGKKESAKMKRTQTPTSNKKVSPSKQESPKVKLTQTPTSNKKVLSSKQESPKVKLTQTPSSNKKIPSSEQKSAKVMQTQALTSNKKLLSGKKESAKMKRTQTPNFKQIHQKAFDKMESIDDYQKRKILSSAKKIGKSSVKVKTAKVKSKIPLPFSGIPFIPSTTSTVGLNFDFGSRTTKNEASADKVVSQPKVKSVFAPKNEGKSKTTASKENVGRKTKTKFDLKASLSRKLGYIPYTGHLKPLSEVNNSDIPAAPCVHNVKENKSRIVVENRSKTRALLKGVRTNKRFELLMKNRNIH